ncbi:MAG: helix-turn-helix transcriptional regulator [Salegentibacter mishustinae]|nr:helix-turn-helix transcriptional regulator [Salegentibacter mishustinae]
MTNFGEYIKKLREEKGWTQTEFGAMIGINSSAISRIENNSKNLNFEKLDKLSEIFNVDLMDLKEIYFANKFARDIIKYDCPDSALLLAEKTVQYLKSKNTKQLKFDTL